MTKEFKSTEPFTLDTKIYEATSEDTSFLGFIEGYAATNFKDRYEEIITDKALKNGAKDLLKHSTVFVDHNYNVDAAVGLVLESKFKKGDGINGIYIKVGISKTATELWTKIKEGVVKAFSIGGIWKDYEYDKETETGMIKDIELWEVSVVGMPANPTALMSNLAMKFIKSIKEETTEPVVEEVTEPKVEEKEENEIIEVKTMVDEPEYRQKMLEMDAKLAELGKNQSDSLSKMTDTVGTLIDAIKPILDEKKLSNELAERESIQVQKSAEEFSKLPYHKQLRSNMRSIVRCIQDSGVDDTVLLGTDEWQPSAYFRDPNEMREEKRRLGL